MGNYFIVGIMMTAIWRTSD